MAVSLFAIDGFELWKDTPSNTADINSSNAPTVGGMQYNSSGTGTGSAYVTGRDGVGRALRLGTSTTDQRALRYTFGTLGDGAEMFFGANIKIGSQQTTPSAFHRVLMVMQATVTRLSFNFNMTTKAWEVTIGTLGGTQLVTGTPTQDPTNIWVGVEVRIFRDATVGKIQLWQEKADNTMELVLDYTGDTSTAVLSTMNGLQMTSSFITSSNRMSNDYDDFWVATGGRPGEPIYVQTYPPTSDFAQAWTPSTGTDHFAVVDEQPQAPADYISTTTGNVKDLFGISAMPRDPNSIFGVQALIIGARASGASTFSNRAVIRDSGGTSQNGTSNSWLTIATFNQRHLLELNPVGSVPWSKAEVEALKFGPECTTTLSSSEGRVYATGLQVLQSLALAPVVVPNPQVVVCTNG